jgi:hypothetical protein
MTEVSDFRQYGTCSVEMPRYFLIFTVLLAGGIGASTLCATEGFAFFESQVRPLLVKHCYECHSEEAGKQKGGLWLDRKAGWETGGDGGPSIIPGNPDASLLIHSIRYGDENLQMPPKSKMTTEEIAVLEQWVAMGAPDPRDTALAAVVRKGEIDYAAARQGWAFRPVVKAASPEVATKDWPLDPVDSFVLAKLEEKQLNPAPAAEPAALLRRLHYDLTGLPPTAEETQAFVDDPSREHFVRIVDELLARPAFGEKWGRHWLDVARYADSNGGDRNYTFYQAWRYRNHVIDAFNRDQFYHEFVREQIAGDLMPSDDPATTRRRLIASTFLALGPKMLTERDKEKLWLDTVDEQVDTMGRAFLGLTLGCARCHDHKFDPVSQEDYFALAGIFRSTEIVTGTRNGCVNVASWIERPLPGPNGVDPELAKQVERLELAMRLVVEKSYMKKAGGKMTADNLPLAGVVYDESDAEVVGVWPSSNLSPNRFGAHYLRDDKEGKGEKRVIFRGSLPESGLYEVRVAYSAGPNRAEKVPMVVKSRAGNQTVHLDQTKTPSVAGLFEPIGQFDFEKGGECSVTIETTGTEGRYVLVDAVQFIAVRDLAREQEQLNAATGGGKRSALPHERGRSEEDPRQAHRRVERQGRRHGSARREGARRHPSAHPRRDRSAGSCRRAWVPEVALQSRNPNRPRHERSPRARRLAHGRGGRTPRPRLRQPRLGPSLRARSRRVGRQLRSPRHRRDAIPSCSTGLPRPSARRADRRNNSCVVSSSAAPTDSGRILTKSLVAGDPENELFGRHSPSPPHRRGDPRQRPFLLGSSRPHPRRSDRVRHRDRSR